MTRRDSTCRDIVVKGVHTHRERFCFKRVRWNDRLAPAANGSCGWFMGQRISWGLSYISLGTLVYEAGVWGLNKYVYIHFSLLVEIIPGGTSVLMVIEGKARPGYRGAAEALCAWRAVSQNHASCLKRKHFGRQRRIIIKLKWLRIECSLGRAAY